MYLPKKYWVEKNLNETYALGNCSGEIKWIFKPSIKEGDESCENDFNMATREFVASLLNKDKQFPIPKTILVNLNGWIGSAQFFVDHTKALENVKNQSVSEKEMQSLCYF